MSAFAAVSASSCAAHEGLALALADELGCNTSDAPAAIRRLAAELPRDAEPAHALDAVGELCRRRLPARRDGALLLPDVLRRGGGAPAAVAVAATVAAQTAGYAVGLVGGGGRLLIAHHLSDDAVVVDPVGRLVDARTLGIELEWRCAHESAADILERARGRAERHGDLPLAIAAQALTLQLPLADTSRAAAVATHGRLLSRLN